MVNMNSVIVSCEPCQLWPGSVLHFPSWIDPGDEISPEPGIFDNDVPGEVDYEDLAMSHGFFV